MFNIDYNKLILWLVPTFLRKSKMIALLRVYCAPVSVLYSAFLANRQNNLYKLNHNGQVFSMEKMLNDLFDNALRRVYVTDGFTKDPTYIYTEAENKPKHLGALILYNEGDYADTGVDFLVWIPAMLATEQTKLAMKGQIDFYKLAGKRYKIYTI